MNDSYNLPDRSIGKKLKDARFVQSYTLAQVSSATKIRVEYLEALESDNFSKFDSHVYAKGFIRNYALFLNLDPKPLIALYRRDFENIGKKRKVQKDQPAGEKSKKKLKIETEITKEKIAYGFIGIVVLFFSVTLVAFLHNTFKPPFIRLTNPEVQSSETYKYLETQDKSIRIQGETEVGTLIKVNEEPVAIKPGFSFESDYLPLTSQNNIIEIEATSQLGIKSNIRLEFVRTDLNGVKSDSNDVLVQVKEKPIFLLIRSDGDIKFNDIAVPNEAINITSEKFIEIETSEPQYVTVQIGETNYQLEKSFERFEFGEKVIRLNQ